MLTIPVRTNLSTTPLAGSATFTSSAIKVQRATAVAVAAFADVAGNVIIEQSRDGSTWRAPAQVAVNAGALTIVETKVVMPWIRVRYVNGATIQAAFDLNLTVFGS